MLVESWHFNIRFFLHAWLYQIGIATYIAVYCSLFVVGKKTSLHLPQLITDHGAHDVRAARVGRFNRGLYDTSLE